MCWGEKLFSCTLIGEQVHFVTMTTLFLLQKLCEVMILQRFKVDRDLLAHFLQTVAGTKALV